MPFTPLHLGLGMVAKSVAPKQFSLLIFTGVQVLMDIEPLIAMILGWHSLHFYTHNLIGAFLIGSLAILLGRPLSLWYLNIIHRQQHHISLRMAIISAYIGSFSHISLDAFMHVDMFPLLPFSLQQPLLHLIPYPQLEAFCIIMLMVGALGLGYRYINHIGSR